MGAEGTVGVGTRIVYHETHEIGKRGLTAKREELRKGMAVLWAQINSGLGSASGVSPLWDRRNRGETPLPLWLRYL